MAFRSTLIFAVLGNILKNKSMRLYEEHISNDAEWGTVSSFILLRYLTMSASEDVRQIVLDNYISLQRLPVKVLYKWLLKEIPQQPSGFIKYIK